MKILINSERRNIPLTTHHPRDQEYCQHQTREAFLPQSGVLSINIYWDFLEREQGEEREPGFALTVSRPSLSCLLTR